MKENKRFIKVISVEEGYSILDTVKFSDSIKENIVKEIEEAEDELLCVTKVLCKDFVRENSLTPDEIVDLLNQLYFEKNNNWNILLDFMKIVNEFQYYFNGDVDSLDDLDYIDFRDLKRLSNVSRDMLQNMDVEVLE